MTAAKHDALPLYLGADYCAHPEPAEDAPERDEWDADHSYGVEGERLCLLTPMAGTYCPACTETAAEEEDLPIGEYVACRETAATTGEQK
jgi:hypothetical protein